MRRFNEETVVELLARGYKLVRIHAGIEVIPAHFENWYELDQSKVQFEPTKEQMIAWKPGWIPNSSIRMWDSQNECLSEWNELVPAGTIAVRPTMEVLAYILVVNFIETRSYPFGDFDSISCANRYGEDCHFVFESSEEDIRYGRLYLRPVNDDYASSHYLLDFLVPEIEEIEQA